jgi:hydrogenase large subunit
MAVALTLNLPFNRVEGDLEVKVELQDGVVTEAWCSGTMFRGFERLLAGRAALDGLVLTPRICGICSSAHQTAAARALDAIAGAEVPADGSRVRHCVLMIETIQSDIRHGCLMFGADFANPHYRGHSLYQPAVARYQPFAGERVRQTVRETKRLLEALQLLAGQWPHSSFMVPGGVTCQPGAGDLQHCRVLVAGFRRWYEATVLGCTVEQWLDVRRAADLERWLEQAEAHRESDVGFLLRFGREAGLATIGAGHGNFLSYGAFDLPDGTRVRGPRRDGFLVPAGFARGTRVEAFEQSKIAEHTACSWFADDVPARHPSQGRTEPYASGHEGRRYSWAKAPRYDGLPAETGPLAEAVIAGHPLFADLVDQQGPSALVRELARLTRPAELLPALDSWLREIAADGDCYQDPGPIEAGQGCGLTQAARGALGHWVGLADSAIAHYQVITPTAWHASPRDEQGLRGCTEQALLGTPVADPDNPVELGHVVRSFDHCLVCTVHMVRRGRTVGRLQVGP